MVRLVVRDHQEKILGAAPIQEVDSPIGAAVGIGEVLCEIWSPVGTHLPGSIALLFRELLEVASHIVPILRVPVDPILWA
jgi:hypothetical protein